MKDLRVEISDDLNDRLQNYCIHQGVKSNIVRKALKEYLDKLDKVYATEKEN